MELIRLILGFLATIGAIFFLFRFMSTEDPKHGIWAIIMGQAVNQMMP
jgi:hypothetical protein